MVQFGLVCTGAWRDVSRDRTTVVFQAIEALLEIVWDSSADFGSIYRFHDGVVKSTNLTCAVSQGIGAVRLCELSDGKNEIEERIVAWEPMKKIGVEFKRTSLPIAEAHSEFLFEDSMA